MDVGFIHAELKDLKNIKNILEKGINTFRIGSDYAIMFREVKDVVEKLENGSTRHRVMLEKKWFNKLVETIKPHFVLSIAEKNSIKKIEELLKEC